MVRTLAGLVAIVGAVGIARSGGLVLKLCFSVLGLVSKAIGSGILV
jgi:hypothetical protein